MAREKKEGKEKRKSFGGLFIPAGILIGMGLGFLFGNLTAYMFIGLGAGFLIWAIYEIMRKKEINPD